jgi:hypothetical protein
MAILFNNCPDCHALRSGYCKRCDIPASAEAYQKGADPARHVPLLVRPTVEQIREAWGPDLLEKQRQFYEAFAEGLIAADISRRNVPPLGPPERRGSAFVDPETGEVYAHLAAACEARPDWCRHFVPDATRAEEATWRACGNRHISARPPLSPLARRALAGATQAAARYRQAGQEADRQRPHVCTTCGGVGSAGGCLACGVVGQNGRVGVEASAHVARFLRGKSQQAKGMSDV